MEIVSSIMHFKCNSTLVLIAAAVAVVAWSVFSAPVMASVHDGIAALQQQRLDRRAEMVRVKIVIVVAVTGRCEGQSFPIAFDISGVTRQLKISVQYFACSSGMEISALRTRKKWARRSACILV